MGKHKKGKVTIDSQAQAQATIVEVDAQINSVDNDTVNDTAIVTVEDTAKSKLAVAIMTIKRSQAALRVNQFKIALTLKKVYDEELFKAGGYKNVYEFAQSEFDYRKASTNNMIRIATAFLDASEEDRIKTIFAKGEIDFKFSQLAELLSVPVEKAKELVDNGIINADTPVKEIRDIVKSIKAENQKTENTAENETQNSEVDTANSLETRQNDSVKSEVEKLKRQLAELQAENAKLYEENQKLQAENETQKNENSFLKSELSKKTPKKIVLSNVRF